MDPLTPIDASPNLKGAGAKGPTAAGSLSFVNDLIYSRTGNAGHRFILNALFVVWFLFVAFQTWTHLVWRDEVRAFSKALEGRNLIEMLKALHGEGHPAVWYILLRVAHDLVPRPEILLVISVTVATAAILLVLRRSPFSVLVLILILFSNFSTYEYSVMARNYGISMLLLFLFASLYTRCRDRGWVLGVLLLLLANTNAIADVAVCGLLLLWLLDVRSTPVEQRARLMRAFLRNGAIAVAGMVIAFLTVFPTVNDAAAKDTAGLTLRSVSSGMFLPGRQFEEVSTLPRTDRLVKSAPAVEGPLWLLQSVLLFGSTLGLVRRPGAFLAGLTTLVVISVFFVVIYPGYYRHEAIWIVLMICLYWIAWPGNSESEPALPNWLRPLAGKLSIAGTTMFAILLVMQLPYSAVRFARAVGNPSAAMHSRNNNFASLVGHDPDLSRATVVADPDYLLETLPYYASNPLWLTREQRYGKVVHFTRTARINLSLGDLLADARRIKEQNRVPVVILLSQKPKPDAPESHREAYNWTFEVTPESVQDLEKSTTFLGHRTAPLGSDEEYYVWVLK